MMINNSGVPLVFLTTLNGHAPTGRNARAHARSEYAKRTNPVRPGSGTFGMFSLAVDGLDTRADEQGPPKRLRTGDYGHSEDSEHAGSLCLSNPPVRILATQFLCARSPVSPSINFEDVLRVAAFHIRRRAAQIVHSDPDRTLDALRCRQWCSVTAPFASLGRSPYLDSAIAAVVSKVHQVVLGASSHQSMLISYTEALQCLRAAVLDPSQHDQDDMLAASQLLAIYEMLDFPENASWTEHVAGAAAMAKLQLSNTTSRRHTNLQAGPMFVEALLSNDESFFDGPHWRNLLQILTIKDTMVSNAAYEHIACFKALRSVFARHHLAISSGPDLDWSVRLPLLSQAHELRSRIKDLIIQDDRRLTEAAKKSKQFDILGLYLISVIMLDRLILSLRRNSHGSSVDLEEDTQGLCCQMIRMELHASDSHPGEELLLALQRQVTYPALTYAS